MRNHLKYPPVQPKHGGDEEDHLERCREKRRFLEPYYLLRHLPSRIKNSARREAAGSRQLRFFEISGKLKFAPCSEDGAFHKTNPRASREAADPRTDLGRAGAQGTRGPHTERIFALHVAYRTSTAHMSEQQGASKTAAAATMAGAGTATEQLPMQT